MVKKAKFEEPLFILTYFSFDDVILASDTDGKWKSEWEQ